MTESVGRPHNLSAPSGVAKSTIVDVARQAGVSVSTVSHVVNETRRVSPETRRLVEAAITSVGYQPNTLARSLKIATTKSVGLAISAISNPYFSDIICAIVSECARLGLMVFLSDTQDDPKTELSVVKALYQRRVDGIILAPSPDPLERAQHYIESARIPCVLVDRMPNELFDQVGLNNRGAIGLLVAHLASFGHRRIGFIAGHPGFATTLERIDGYRSAVATHGLEVDEALLVAGNATTAEATASAHSLMALPRPPTALIAGNNMATIGAMRAIRALNLKAPSDISIAGVDDFEWADCFDPRLTVVAQPCEEIGRQAAALLSERIASFDGPRRTIRLDGTMIQRDSCGPPP
jgi:LacI family transcriptional regulator